MISAQTVWWSVDASLTQVERDGLSQAVASTQVPGFDGVAYKHIDLTKALPICAAVMDQLDVHPEAVAVRARVVDKSGNPAKAFAIAMQAAEKGSGMAMNLIGSDYDRGGSVTRDEVPATAWYRKASDAGFAMATSNLARRYLHGRGIGKDRDLVLNLYGRAGHEGCAYTYRALGDLFRKGEHVQRSMPRAAQYYVKGTDLGDGPSMFHLTQMLEFGADGVRAKPDFAAQLYNDVFLTPATPHAGDY